MIGSEIPGPLNLGNPEEFSVFDFARLVLRITGSRSSVVYRPLPQDDPSRRCPQIARAHELLGWRPEIGAEAGLRRTIEWFERRLMKSALPDPPGTPFLLSSAAEYDVEHIPGSWR